MGQWVTASTSDNDVNKDLGLKAEPKAKDSRYQDQIFYRSLTSCIVFFTVKVLWVFFTV